MTRIWVGTRKGLFSVEKKGSSWEIEDRGFLGVPVTMTLFDGRSESWLAGVKHGHFGTKLHRSRDGGRSWAELAAPKYPEKPDDPSDKNPWSLDTIWSLEAGRADQKGRIWCGTIPGGVFVSDDDGDSWSLVEPLWAEHKTWFGGGADHPGVHSIWIDPKDGKKVGIGVSIGGVFLSDDDGRSWRQAANGMRNAYMPPEQAYEPGTQDPHRIVCAPSNPQVLWCQHHNGIFRSTNGGTQWDEIEDVPPSVFGFAVVVHPKDPETAWFVPAQKDELRFPVDGKVVVSRTRDGGRSFEVLRDGLPQHYAYDLTYRHALDVDTTGEILTFGTTTGALFVSEDGGDRWLEVTAHLPPIYSVRFE